LLEPRTRRSFLRLLSAAPLLLHAPSPALLWTASFRHPGLQQPATLRAWDDACLFDMRGSRPQTIRLPLRRKCRTAAGVVACAYAGWPRRADGSVTGVRNQSADPPGARWIEHKLGPTLVWAAAGCEALCVRSTLLRFSVAVQRGDATIVVADVRDPTIECDCLAPRFASDAAAGRPRWLGAIDQPGSTFADLGDMFADLAGRRWQVAADDRLRIVFRQRAELIADDVPVLDDEFGFTLTAALGRPAHDIAADIGWGSATDFCKATSASRGTRDDGPTAQQAQRSRRSAFS
jgi:hypothetical protein